MFVIAPGGFRLPASSLGLETGINCLRSSWKLEAGSLKQQRCSFIAPGGFRLPASSLGLETGINCLRSSWKLEAGSLKQQRCSS